MEGNEQEYAEILSGIYSSPSSPGGFSSAKRLLRAAREAGHTQIKLAHVRKWLEGSTTYTKFAKARRRFRTNQWVAAGLNSFHHADLAVFLDIRKHNDGVGYLLVCVDVLSRFICVEPVETKHANSVCKAYERILSREPGRIPSRLVTDRGGEFLGRPFQRLLSQQQIVHVIPKNTDLKACYAENAIFRIKNKLEKWFHANNTYRWLDVIQQIVHGLNHTLLISIGMMPAAVTHENADLIHARLYKEKKRQRVRFNAGDVVRISTYKGTFAKGTRNFRFTEELFRVKRIIHRDRIPCYILEDLNKKEIDAFFYADELQLFRPGHDNVYVIDKILKKRRQKGKVEYFVSFRGYGPEFNEWVDHSALSTV